MKLLLWLSRRQPIVRPARSLAALSALVVLPICSIRVRSQTTNPGPAPDSSPSASSPGSGEGSKPSDTPDSAISLTPFEVNATQEHGYFSATTLAGTRLNNNIADLPSSISIVTRQELLDTNSQNINDVFRYQANTEGASTYTPVTLVRGNVSDVLGNQPLVSGNRVRGLSAADTDRKSVV